MRKTLVSTVLATSLLLSYDVPRPVQTTDMPATCRYTAPCYEVQGDQIHVEACEQENTYQAQLYFLR